MRYLSTDTALDTKVLIKHSQALAALRGCVDSKVRAGEGETLAAVMLLLICQVSQRPEL